MLTDFEPRPHCIVVEGHDVAFVLDLSFGRAFVDAPLVGGVELL